MGSISKLVEDTSGVQSPFQKFCFATTAQKLRKSRYQSILVLSNFASSFNFAKTFWTGLQLIFKSSQVEGSQASKNVYIVQWHI